ncbi:MAG: VWA domain-containing protein [Terracidiphilus sp.]
MNPQLQCILCSSLLMGAAIQISGQASPLPSQDNKPVLLFVTASGDKVSPDMLSPSNLNVYIDKQPTKVVSLRSAKEDKLLFAVLVDVSKSEAPRAELVKETAGQIFDALSKNGNLGYLVFFSHLVATSKAPLDTSTARLAIDRVKFGGGTALFDAIGETCRLLLKRSTNPDAPRRVIVLLSDGGDNSSHITLKKAEEGAEEEGIAIFSLSDQTTDSIGEHNLKEVAQETGGDTITAKKRGEGVIPLIDAINGQWALTLSSSQGSDKNLHTLAIKGAEKNVRLSAPARIPLQ